MDLNPAYTSVGSLFNDKPMFFIPKYQRAYAWETGSIKDFIKDLENCFLKRKQKAPINHFFGGILSVEYAVQGIARQHEYEIIDGQQRIATFTLLMACVIDIYKDLLKEAQHIQDVTNPPILESRISGLSSRFIEFHQEVQRTVKVMPVLKLSKPDQSFYNTLIKSPKGSLEISRDSHKKLSISCKEIYKAIEKMIDKSTIETKMDDLEIIKDVMEEDFRVLHMVTKSREDAFRLFQVINDRGTSLTEGDLLRAKTLEILEGFEDDQNKVESCWDNILADSPNKTANYLHWIYESNAKERASQNALFDYFIDYFFPQHTKPFLTPDEAKKVSITMQDIYEDIVKCRKLVDGEWLYPNQQPITWWDRNRLSLLVKELDHTLCIPLLLAASKLDHCKFSEIVQLIEKVFFRYKIICNQHATPLQTIYREEASRIRIEGKQYKIENLEEKLRKLIKEKASDQRFQANLELLHYKRSGDGSNKPLKYFLLSVEYYYSWFKQGATGSPRCYDKSRVYDFTSTSIEHIYPKNVKIGSSLFNQNLEDCKNLIGNLTILDPSENTIANDDNFLTKKPIYQRSAALLTRDEIGGKTDWTLQEVEAHKKLLINIGMKVFQI